VLGLSMPIPILTNPVERLLLRVEGTPPAHLSSPNRRYSDATSSADTM
jgi:hypothetical protein